MKPRNILGRNPKTKKENIAESKKITRRNPKIPNVRRKSQKCQEEIQKKGEIQNKFIEKFNLFTNLFVFL